MMSPWAFVSLRRTWVFAISFFLLSAAGAGNHASRPFAAQPVNHDRNSRPELLPSFEPNLGQADPRVKFLSRGRGYTLFLTKDEAVLVVQKPEVRSQKPEEERRPLSVVRGQLPGNGNWKFETQNSAAHHLLSASGSLLPSLRTPTPNSNSAPPSVLRLRLLGASAAGKVAGLDELPGKSNYFIGNDPKKWRTNVPTYGKVRYESVYPGVDLVYYGKPGGQLEYDFVVAPGADPRAITLGIGAGRPVSGRQKAEGSGQASEVGCPLFPDPSTAEEGGETTFPSLLRRGPGGGCSRRAGSVPMDHGLRTTDVGQFKIQNSRFKIDVRQSKIQNRKSKIASPLRLAANGDLVVTTEGGEVRLHKPVVYQTESRVESRQSKVESRTAPCNPKFKIQDSKLRQRTTDQGQLKSDNPKSKIQDSKLRQRTTDQGQLTSDNSKFKIQNSITRQRTTDRGQLTSGNSKFKIQNSITRQRTTDSGQLTSANSKFKIQDSKLTQRTTDNGQRTSGNPKSKIQDSRLRQRTTDRGQLTSGNPKSKIQDSKLRQRTTDRGQLASGNSKFKIKNSKLIDARYVLKSDGKVTFEIAPYDRTLPLVIDPVLSYSTYLGGSDMDYANGIAVDTSGNAYVTGYTASTDFPLVNPAQSSPGGGTCSDGVDAVACFDAFVAKLNPTGTALVYSTYLGGSNEDYGAGIALDASGHAHVTGYTNSTDFPVQQALQPQNAGGYDAFVAELSADGASLIYSTYWGGSLDDIGTGIAIDSSGNAYVSGYTASPDFPVTSGAFQGAYGGGAQNGFVVKFNSGGAQLGYSTFLGGSGDDYAYAAAVDSAGNAYVTGATNSTNFPTVNAFQPNYADGLCAPAPNTFPCYDAFVTKLTPTGSALVFSTYLGGTGSDYGYAIALDSSANAYITGYTTSTNLPTTAGAFERVFGGSYDAFVAKLDGAGSTLDYSTYLGGSGTEVGYGIAVDSAGSAFVTGYNYGGHFPTVNPVQGQSAGFYDAFVSALDPTGGSLIFSTYLGGSQDDFGRGIALGPSGNAYVTGATFSLDFPTTSGSFQPSYAGGPYDAFVTMYNAPTMPRAALSPSSFDFGSQEVGTTSSPETIALTNNGHVALTISSIAASGDFSQTNTCGSSVAAGASCTISVTFTPTAAGTRSGSITITDNASPATQTVSLTGTGAAPLVNISPTSLNFPAQLVGTSSSPQSLTLTNAGNATLTITSITASGDFSQTNTCSSNLAAGASCTISVAFKPTATGTRTGTVIIADNANPATQTVSLSGSGVLAPVVSLSPTSLTFSSQAVGASSSPQSVTLKNTGKAMLSISSIKTSGDFSQTNTCGSSLAASASCTLRVSFKPTASGTRTGSLTVTDNACPATQTVSLAGTGAGPAVSLSPASLTFPSQTVGTSSSPQTVTLKNTGNAMLGIVGIRASGDFSQTHTCGPSVAVGASCTLSVTFKPTATGTRTGTLTITDNSIPPTQTVSLTGTGGAKTTVTYSPTSLTFSAQTVGTASPAQIVTLTNTGSATLSIASISASGDSSQTNNCGSSVAPNASCALSVAFNPAGGGVRTGAVTITDSANGSPQTVALTGTGEDFNFSASPGSPTSATVSPGGTATYALSIVAVGGLNQNTTFTCSGAPSEARCAVSPASLTLSSSPANVTVTVATTASSLATPRYSPPSPLRPARPVTWLLWAMAFVASGSWAWAIQGRMRPGAGRSRTALAAFAALFQLALAMAACGGGGGGIGAAPSASNSGTPPGTYTLTATGTCSSCSTSLSHSVNLTLQVQ